MNNKIDNNSANAFDFSHFFGHYLSLFWRNKWFIIICGSLVLIVTMAILIKVYSISPRLSATAIIGIEKTSDIMAVKDAGGFGEGRGDLITSRFFLKSIVDTLSLRLKLDKYNRNEIFNSVKVDYTAKEGKYIFIPQNSTVSYKVIFQKNSFAKKEIINISDPKKIDLLGIHCTFSDTFLRKSHTFSFSVNNSGYAINDLYNNLSIQDVDVQKSRFNIIVSVSGSDYQLITDCVNMIATTFVQRNLNFRKQKSRNTIDILEEQYNSAYDELQSAEIALKNFRTLNPKVGLSMETAQTITTLSGLETDQYTQSANLNEAIELHKKYLQDNGQAHLQIAFEILAFLNSRNVPFAQILQTELNELVTEKQNLLNNNFSEDHPRLVENEQKINSKETSIEKVLNDFINQAQFKIKDNSTSINGLNKHLRDLPSEELTLAQLQRKQQICLDVYTMVMNRYNQAKVADASIVADVFVMEKAIAPEPPPLNLLQIIGFGLLLGILLSFGPVLIYDKADKTARTVTEFKQLSNKHVIESIPVISQNEIVSVRSASILSKDASNHIHLIDESASINHYYVSEILRALRTKILMKMHDLQDKSIVITSVERGVGKTTIACNLASVIAQINLRVILIDGDMRCGGVHNFFACENNKGLQELLSSEKNIDETTILNYIKQTSVPNLSIISSGDIINNPSELLSSLQLVQAKKILSSMFDIIIMDCPPLGAVTDAAVVYEHFSNYCIIAKAGSTNINDLTRKLKEYPLVEKKVLGIILNFSALDKNINYYRKTKYYS